jgi:hypothetical protein
MFLNMQEPMGLFRGWKFGNGSPWYRPALVFRGNTAHSSGFYAPTFGVSCLCFVSGAHSLLAQQACIYQGGWLRFNRSNNYLDFSSGVQARATLNAEDGTPTTMEWFDTKVWRCNNNGVTYRSASAIALRGLEVHDCGTAASIVGGNVTLTNALLNVLPLWLSGLTRDAKLTGLLFNDSSTTTVALQNITFRGFDKSPNDTAFRVDKVTKVNLISGLTFENTLASCVALPSLGVLGAGAQRNQCAFPLDFNHDGLVDVADMEMLLQHWLGAPAWQGEDCNGDGIIDVVDVGCILDGFIIKTVF